MNDAQIILILRIAADGEHLSGTVRSGGAERAFSGRLGLMGAIDAFVIDDADVASPSTTKEHS